MPIATLTVAFSMRNLRTDLRDRLHMLAAIIEARTKRKTTMEAVVNMALEAGIKEMETEWLGPKLAAKVAAARGGGNGAS